MLSHAGPITRTVRDSALLFDILSGPDPLDHQALPRPHESFLARCAIPLRPLRIAYCPTLFGVAVDPQIGAALEAAVERIARALPVQIDTPQLEWRDPLPIFETLWVAGRGIVYGRSLAARSAELEPGFAALIGRSAQYDLAAYLDAVQRRAAFANDVHALFERYDLLITPTLPVLPFDARHIGPPEFADDGSAVPWARWTPFTYPFNLSGNPAASVPCGWSAQGLPIGMQVIGPRFDDAGVLQFCAAFEALEPWDAHVPTPSAKVAA
jgi:aspartyl-tRNA(Asn)/glutamyl-tRNA(Gln) amidotransferase subunit A